MTVWLDSLYWAFRGDAKWRLGYVFVWGWERKLLTCITRLVKYSASELVGSMIGSGIEPMGPRGQQCCCAIVLSGMKE